MEAAETLPSSRNHAAVVPVAPGVAYLTLFFVNAYLVGEREGSWVLIDTGLPGTSGLLRGAVAKHWGKDARPQAIILTHGHFDHAGSALDLADFWGVPIYAHPMEMPFLAGRSDYPPQDPTMGGAIAFLSRTFPHSGIDLGSRVNTLPEDGSVPEMPGWRWIHTPGHTPGHISLFRDEDRALIAGDALATFNMDSWLSHLTEQQEFDRPPVPFTPDWDATESSIQRLSELNPSVIGAGHGIPMVGPEAAEELRKFAGRSLRPPKGRYTTEAARYNENGVVWVPPPVPDPLPKILAFGALAAGAIAGAAYLLKRRQD